MNDLKEKKSWRGTVHKVHATTEFTLAWILGFARCPPLGAASHRSGSAARWWLEFLKNLHSHQLREQYPWSCHEDIHIPSFHISSLPPMHPFGECTQFGTEAPLPELLPADHRHSDCDQEPPDVLAQPWTHDWRAHALDSILSWHCGTPPDFLCGKSRKDAQCLLKLSCRLRWLLKQNVQVESRCIHFFFFCCARVRRACAQRLNFVAPAQECGLTTWYNNDVHFSRKSSLSPPHVSAHHQIRLDMVGSHSRKMAFALVLPAFRIFFAIDFAKCHTSYWGLIEYDLIRAVIWRLLSVTIVATFKAERIRVNARWNPVFSIATLLVVSVHCTSSKSTIKSVSVSINVYVPYLAENLGLSHRQSPDNTSFFRVSKLTTRSASVIHADIIVGNTKIPEFGKTSISIKGYTHEGEDVRKLREHSVTKDDCCCKENVAFEKKEKKNSHKVCDAFICFREWKSCTKINKTLSSYCS